MSSFRSALRFQDDTGLPFTLTSPLIYDSALAHLTIIVPIGFKTDLASIPRVLWNVLPPIGRYDHAAVLHDFLYQTDGMTRRIADGVLNEAMAVSHVGRMARWTIYLAVRAGGWHIWQRYRQAEQVHG